MIEQLITAVMVCICRLSAASIYSGQTGNTYTVAALLLGMSCHELLHTSVILNLSIIYSNMASQ